MIENLSKIKQGVSQLKGDIIIVTEASINPLNSGIKYIGLYTTRLKSKNFAVCSHSLCTCAA
jgi:hypothetical protein